MSFWPVTNFRIALFLTWYFLFLCLLSTFSPLPLDPGNCLQSKGVHLIFCLQTDCQVEIISSQSTVWYPGWCVCRMNFLTRYFDNVKNSVLEVKWWKVKCFLMEGSSPWTGNTVCRSTFSRDRIKK